MDPYSPRLLVLYIIYLVLQAKEKNGICRFKLIFVRRLGLWGFLSNISNIAQTARRLWHKRSNRRCHFPGTEIWTQNDSHTFKMLLQTVWLRVYKGVTKLCKDDETEDPVDKDEEEQEEQVGDKVEDEKTKHWFDGFNINVSRWRRRWRRRTTLKSLTMAKKPLLRKIRLMGRSKWEMTREWSW